MGCAQNSINSDSKHDIEIDIRSWESTTEFSSKFFLDAVFEINTKIHLDGEVMSKEKFENYFLRSYGKRTTQDFFDNDMMKKGEDYDTIKIKNLLFLITTPKRIETIKNCFFYDKANYLFSFIKDYDRDECDYIERVSPGLRLFLNDLVRFSLDLIPELWMKTDKKALQYSDNKLFELKFKSEKIIDDLIVYIFQDDINLDKTKLTLDALNDMFERDNGFLSDGFIREFSLNIF
jgi:hypothetical protein